MMSSRGNSATGNSAVIGMLAASVIHQTAISAATAAVRCARGSMPSGAGRIRMARNSNSPAANPIFWRSPYCSLSAGTVILGPPSGGRIHNLAWMFDAPEPLMEQTGMAAG